MTIADIAKMAGVSNAAVSRYFNNGYISEEKRQAIQKVVEETGYRPSIQAQTLRSKKTRMIGLVIPKIASYSIGSVVEGIMGELNDKDYQMLFADTANNPQKELEYLNVFREKQVDGVILVATILTAEHKRLLKELRVPVIIIGQRLSGYSCVYYDDYHSIYDVTKLFIEKKCKTLGYISAPHEDKAAGISRYKGFLDAIEEVGHGKIDYCEEIGDFSFQSGYKKCKELLENCRNLDGIICATDTMCIGALQYLKEEGIRIPQDIRLAGHGNAIYTQVTTPSITTVQYSYQESGEIAAKLLLKQLGKEDVVAKEIMLGYSIKERESTQ